VNLPSITVITPCLNARDTVERAVASVAEQGYEPLEHVVVDGGSTDGTLELLSRHPALVVESGQDRGLSHAMNKGIDIASGDIIGWLNADDFYLPGALQRVGEAFAAQPEALWAAGACVIVDADDREVRRFVTWYKRFLLRHYRFGLNLTQNFIAAPATFVRRETLRELGGFDERFRYSMDYDVWLKLGRRGAPIVIDAPLAAFRMAEGSLSMSGFETQFAEHRQNAIEHGQDHRLAVGVNRLVSAAIVAIYRGLRVIRRLRSR
jgi:GT2 family glycosyltransferase